MGKKEDSYAYVTCIYCGQQIGCRASNLKNLLDSLRDNGCPNPSCCSNGDIGEFIVESVES